MILVSHSTFGLLGGTHGPDELRENARFGNPCHILTQTQIYSF